VLTEILLGVRTEAEAKRIARALSAFEFAPELEKSTTRKPPSSTAPAAPRARSSLHEDCLIAQLCLKHGYELLAKIATSTRSARYFR